jgi:hypothetical protein
MAAVEGLGRLGLIDNEGEQGESVVHYRECDGALLFSDEELEDSATSQIDFFGPSNPADHFESSDDRELSGNKDTTHIQAVDVPDDSEDMPALVDVSDTSDDEYLEVSNTDINSNDQEDTNDLHGDLPDPEEVSDSWHDEDCYKKGMDNATNKNCTFSNDKNKV